MNQLWSMINTQQLIVFMPLFNVQMPANAQTFFNEIFKIAAFDIVEVEPYVNFMLHLNGTGPFNDNFDKLGFQSMFFLNNLGPLGIGFLIYFGACLFLLVLDTFSPKSKRAATLSKSLYDQLFYNTITSIMLESYSIMSCCVLINLNYIRWDTWGEVVQTSICMLALVTLIAFPIACVLYARGDWE